MWISYVTQLVLVSAACYVEHPRPEVIDRSLVSISVTVVFDVASYLSIRLSTSWGSAGRPRRPETQPSLRFPFDAWTNAFQEARAINLHSIILNIRAKVVANDDFEKNVWASQY